VISEHQWQVPKRCCASLGGFTSGQVWEEGHTSVLTKVSALLGCEVMVIMPALALGYLKMHAICECTRTFDACNSPCARADQAISVDLR